MFCEKSPGLFFLAGSINLPLYTLFLRCAMSGGYIAWLRYHTVENIWLPTLSFRPSMYFLEDAAGGLLSPLGPSPLCDFMLISDNSLLLYIVQRIMISSLRAQDPHTRTPDTVSSNTPLNSVPTGSWIATVLTAQIISLEHKYS